MSSKISVTNISFVIGSMLAASSASAVPVFTDIQDSRFDEKNHNEILDDWFGESFTQTGLDFFSDSFSAVRVSDDGVAGTIDLLTSGAGDASDIDFGGNVNATVTVIGKEARDRHTLGFNDGSGFNALINSDIIGNSEVVQLPSVFNFEFQNLSTGRDFSSDPGENGSRGSSSGSGGPVPSSDFLVTYRIDGLANPTWALFWEDRTEEDRFFDFDYNDAVFLVTATSRVPSPGSAVLLTGGLIVAAGGARRRKA